MKGIPRGIGGHAMAIVGIMLVGALVAAGCGGGTSSADKTATAVAKGAATATKRAGASTAAATATKSAVATATKAPATTGTPGVTGASTVKIGEVASIGSVLTNPAGLTLYIYKDDVPNSGQSAVPAAIAPNWPPLTVSGDVVAPSGLSGQLATFTRSDGSKQVMYNGMPLYTFVGDSQPGQANGQALLNLWFAATPSAQTSATATPSVGGY
jgi:predicted lipoprotein with Yx(FWY)xxD motif